MDDDGGSCASPVELTETLYGLLQELAGRRVAARAPRSPLQATELVHEAWIRLQADRGARAPDRGRFLIAAASAMRRALVDHARHEHALKRGGGGLRVTLVEEIVQGPEPDLDVLALHDALDALEEAHPDLARLVELRVFAGATRPEVGRELGKTLAQVDSGWEYAKARLARWLAKST